MNADLQWEDIEIIEISKSKYLLKFICEDEIKANDLFSKIKDVKVVCNMTFNAPRMSIEMFLKDNTILYAEYKNVALIWRDCTKINSYGVGYLKDLHALKVLHF